MKNLFATADAALRLVIDEARDYGILLMNLDGTIQTWNRGAQIIFGYTPEEVIGHHFAILFTEADRSSGAPERELANALAVGRAEDARWHVRKGGQPFFGDGVTTAVKEGERSLGFAKIVRDTTERYRTQQRVAAQLALTTLLNTDESIEVTARRIMQTICENLGWDLGTLWEVDPDAALLICIDRWNAPTVPDDVADDLCRGITFARGEGIPGSAWATAGAVWFSDIRDPEKVRRAAQAERGGLRAAFAFPILHAGKTLGVMEFFSREVREPDQALLPVMTLIGVQIGDLIVRRRTQQALQKLLAEEQRHRADLEAAHAQLERRAEEEEAFRHLASALTGAAEMSDVLHEITERATRVTRADGVYVERIIGPEKTVEVVAAAGRGAPIRGLVVAYPGSLTEEIVARRQPVIMADMKEFGRAMAPYLVDTCRDCEVLVTPLVAENEIHGALVLLNSRSSGRRFGEADLVRARTLGDLTSLALRRVRLLEEERQAKRKAEAAVRVRDETLGIVSHDLRNPLTKIGLSADLLAENPSEDRPELIETIRTSARQMLRLIQDLLDVARLESGRLSVHKQVIPAEPIVVHACTSHEPIAAQNGQKVICHVQGPLPDICADRDRMAQVFGNLIGNAIKFTPERGTVTVQAQAEGDFVVFRVSDNGPGIPEADLKNVFRPYWQAKKTAHMGAGLGLAIVKGIVEAHGGRVWAENAEEGGAAFVFTIPRA